MAEYGIEAYHLTAHQDELEVYDIGENITKPKKSKRLKKLLNLMCEKGGIWQLRIYPDGDDEISVQEWTDLLAAHRWKDKKLRIFPDWQADCGIYFFLYPTIERNPHQQVETAPQSIWL